MKFKFFPRASLTLIAAVALVSACGAGDNESAGSLTPFSTVPTSITLTGPDAVTCGSGFSSQVFIYGGAAPYRIDNTDPVSIIVTPGTVSAPGGSFIVEVVPGSCLTNIPLTVNDQTGRQVIVTVSAVVKGT